MTPEETAGLSNLRPDNSALLVIDMSRDFVSPDASEGWGRSGDFTATQAMADRMVPLLKRCRAQGLQIIYINHVHRPGAHDMGTLASRFPAIGDGSVLKAGTRGVEICDTLAPQPGDIVIDKIRQSGFYYTALEPTLKELKIETVIVSGVSVGACVECTARDAVARDFNVVMLSDGTSGAGLPDLGWGAVDPETLQSVFLTNFLFHFGSVASIRQLMEGPLAVRESVAG